MFFKSTRARSLGRPRGSRTRACTPPRPNVPRPHDPHHSNISNPLARLFYVYIPRVHIHRANPGLCFAVVASFFARATRTRRAFSPRFNEREEGTPTRTHTHTRTHNPPLRSRIEEDESTRQTKKEVSALLLLANRRFDRESCTRVGSIADRP